MSSVAGLIGGAFAHMTAPFASHPKDRERAEAYLQAALTAGVTWAEAEQDIRDYLTLKGCTASQIAAQVSKAQPFLEPWLS